MADRPLSGNDSLEHANSDSSDASTGVVEAAASLATFGTNARFPIAGIVASAGGLNAFMDFFNAMPSDSGIAFVLVPHLDATHKSLMTELIGRQTSMPVVEAKESMQAEGDHVYVIPPNQFLAINNGSLHLSELPESNRSQTAIDFFLRSLAADQGARAIGIVLSGTGSHGTLGIREIKQYGGMAMAQAPESAEFDQMPRNAIETGLVDFVLPPEQMPETLIKYVRQPYFNMDSGSVAINEATTSELAAIIKLVRQQTKRDFSCYRSSMLLRRIERRMGLAEISELKQYVEQLRDTPSETQALCDDFLIGVTAFFRDPDAYSVLETEIIPKLVSEHGSETQLRVWVPSCATGEEAYSISILLFEAFMKANISPNFQVFASDVNGASIGIARRGIYPASIVSDVSPKRLTQYFVERDELHYQVSKQLRESVVFSMQNLLSDAPFSKMDLISCRNFLIYLEPEVQQKLIALFHFALVGNGYLVLGPSETVGRELRLFDSVSKKFRIYRRVGPTRTTAPILPTAGNYAQQGITQDAMPYQSKQSYTELAENVILSNYAPATALINKRMEILNVTGPLANFLEFPSGELTKDLLAMARPGLRTKLRLACHKASQTLTEVVDSTASVKRNGVYTKCSITVRPMLKSNSGDGLMLVLFSLTGSSQGKQTVGHQLNDEAETQNDTPHDSIVNVLEFELKTTRAELQDIIQQMGMSNEELQSSNEELESSKEELQSLNEELNTVNCQLLEKVSELDQSNSEISKLMSSTEIATLFLTRQLFIKRFTNPAVELFQPTSLSGNLALHDLESPLVDHDLVNACRQVLGDCQRSESEVSLDDGRCFLRRVLPFRSVDEGNKGLVITFLDITERKRSETKTYEINQQLSAILDTASDAIMMINEFGIIDRVNHATETMFGYSEFELLGQNVSMIVPAPFRDEQENYISRYFAAGDARIHGTGREVICRKKDGCTFPADLSVSQVNQLGLFTGILRDISVRKAMQKHALETAADEQRRIGMELHDGTQQELTGLTLFAASLLEMITIKVIDNDDALPNDVSYQRFRDVDYTKMRATTELMVTRLKEANQHVRDLAHGIMPVQIDADGLRSALSELTDATSTPNVVCELKVAGDFSALQNTAATHLYRIAQEAVSNSLRHGSASHITIRLKKNERELALEVLDNGSGFAVADMADSATSATGLGLRTMEYRANLIGGVLQISTRPEGGTLVRCLVMHEAAENV